MSQDEGECPVTTAATARICTAMAHMQKADTVLARRTNSVLNSFCVSPVSSLMAANKEGYGADHAAFCERAAGVENGGVGVVADDQNTSMHGVLAFVVRCTERRRGHMSPVFDMFVDASKEHTVPCSNRAVTSLP